MFQAMLVKIRNTAAVSIPTGSPSGPLTKKSRTNGKKPRIGMDWRMSMTGSMTDAGEEPRKDRLLRVQTVFRLIKDNRLGPIDYLVRDLQTAMRRQAVHDDRVLLRVVKELRVDLVRLEHLLALLLLFFLAHRDPNVGVHDIGPLHGGNGIIDDVNLGSAVLRDAPRRHEDFGVRLVTAGTGRGHVHADNCGAEEKRIAYVVAVPDVDEFQPLERAPVLQDREEIRDDLAGVFLVIEAVDHRHTRIPGEFEDVLSAERPIHDAVHIAAQHPRGVGDRLAPSDLQVVRAQEEGVTAELGHPDLERHARPGRGLLENHCEALAPERLGRLPPPRSVPDARREG